MLRTTPSDDVVGVLLAAAALGPTLVVVPSVDQARLEAIRLRRAGLTVAVVPEEWALAAGGVDVVIGARAAAWAPCPDLAAAVVLDEHDESLQEERSPTWHARDVVVERARRAGAPVLLVSPCPSLSGLAAVGDLVERPPVDDERGGWPIVEVVDRSRDEPWKTSLVTSALIRHLRDHERTVVCVHNTPGRGRILACRSCRSLVRCERCEAAVGMADDGMLTCRRCGETRPAVCLVCGASAFANLRPGVTRLREELEAAAGRPVAAVVGRDEEPPPDAGVYVGTEAVLHRVKAADVVAFLDIDTELLAPRYRAAEQAMALLVRGARRRRPTWSRRPAASANVPAAPRGRPSGAARRSGADRGVGASPPTFARAATVRRACGGERRRRRRGRGGGATGRGGRRRRRVPVRGPYAPTRGISWVTPSSRPRGPRVRRVRIEVDPQRR